MYFGDFFYDCKLGLFPPQLNGAEATPGTYSCSKMAAGQYQRAMQQFTSALQGGGLGTWLRKPHELGHFNASAWITVLKAEYEGIRMKFLYVCLCEFVDEVQRMWHWTEEKVGNFTSIYEKWLTVWKGPDWRNTGQIDWLCKSVLILPKKKQKTKHNHFEKTPEDTHVQPSYMSPWMDLIFPF